MATHATALDDVSVHLTEDVYQDEFEWAALVNDVTESMDSKTSENVVQDQVKLLLSIVGRDLFKLHCFVQAVQDKIKRQSIWAATVAVKFYW